MQREFNQAAIIRAKELWADFYTDRDSRILRLDCTNKTNNHTTRFFREPHITDGLATARSILNLPPDAKYLIAPGSFGAEALSLAHRLQQHDNGQSKNQIYTVDNDPRVTEIAQLGIFDGSVLKKPDPKYGLETVNLDSSFYRMAQSNVTDLLRVPTATNIQNYGPNFDGQFAITCCLNLSCHLSEIEQYDVIRKLCALTSHVIVLHLTLFKEESVTKKSLGILRRNDFKEVVNINFDNPFNTIAGSIEDIFMHAMGRQYIFVHRNYADKIAPQPLHPVR